MEPVKIPAAQALYDAATAVGGAVDGFDQVVVDIQSSWSGLQTSYSAPEQEVVLQAMARLGPSCDELVSLAGRAESALRAYGDEVAVLATRRSGIISDLADYNSGLADPTDPYAWTEIESAIIRFDVDAAEADERCASALSALHRYYTWSLSDTLDVANGVPSGVLQGLAAELLSRYRELWVPQPGATLPVIPRIDQIVPDEIINGVPHTRLPSGLLVPVGSNLPGPPTTIARPTGWRVSPVLSGNPSLGAPPTWARWGGRSLVVVGAGLTYWGTYTDRYNETLVLHPEWTDSQRNESAVVHSAVVGTTSVATGMGGAWAGAAAGAAIGSIFPGPGTVIGGIVGGIIGGIAGGMAGEAAGDVVMDAATGE